MGKVPSDQRPEAVNEQDLPEAVQEQHLLRRGKISARGQDEGTWSEQRQWGSSGR